MNTFTHASVGAAVALASPNLGVGLVAAIASHVVLDLLPHTDQGTFMTPAQASGRAPLPRWVWTTGYVEVGIAALLVMGLLAALPTTSWPALIIGAFGGVLIDGIDNVPFWSKQFRATAFGRWFHYWHDRAHWTLRGRVWPLGIITQLIVLGGALWFFWKR